VARAAHLAFRDLVALVAAPAEAGPGHLAGTLSYGNREVFRRFADAARSGSEPAEIGPDDALAVLRMQHEVLERAERLEARANGSSEISGVCLRRGRLRAAQPRGPVAADFRPGAALSRFDDDFLLRAYPVGFWLQKVVTFQTPLAAAPFEWPPLSRHHGGELRGRNLALMYVLVSILGLWYLAARRRRLASPPRGEFSRQQPVELRAPVIGCGSLW